MSEQFEPVAPEDFTKITTERLPHQKIEAALILIGGTGVKGMEFSRKVMRAAGWKYERLTTYASHPEVAADAFNRVREILATTDDSEQILALVAQKVAS